MAGKDSGGRSGGITRRIQFLAKINQSHPASKIRVRSTWPRLLHFLPATSLAVLAISRYPGAAGPFVSMKIPFILFSHVALGLAGWGIAREFRSVPTPVQAENSRTRSNRPHPARVPGSELVRSIESRLEKATAAEAQLAAAPTSRDKVLAALTGLALPEDPAASILTLLAADGETASIQAAALFVLWAKSDPTDALQFASNSEEFRMMSCDDEALELVGESLAPEIALSMESGQFRDPVFDGLARQLIASRTVEELVALMEGLETEVKSGISFHIGKQWPAERLDDFGRLATAMKDPEMLNRVDDKLPPEEMARWMMRFVDENPDPEFARAVQEAGTLFFLLRNLPGFPLEGRLAEVMKRPANRMKSPEAARKDALEHLAENDVSGFFHGDAPDLRYAFHHGKIEAPEILAKLAARFPEYAAAGLLPALLHQQLTSEDPDRAASLIADLPAAERARVIVESAWSISSLDTLGRVISNFPVSDDDAVLAARQKIWEAVTDDGLDHYGKDYLRWISSLPNPLDRKLALGAIAKRIEGSMEWKADEIRNIVGDIPLRDTP